MIERLADEILEVCVEKNKTEKKLINWRKVWKKESECAGHGWMIDERVKRCIQREVMRQLCKPLAALSGEK